MGKPAYVEALEKADPEMMKRVTAIREFAGADGALPAKVKTLMMMLVDAILGRADGVKSLSQMARAQGATEGEIAETVRMAFIMGGLPGLVPATRAFEA